MVVLAQTRLAGQTEKEPPRFNVSAVVGVLRPSDESFRALYGGSHVPVAVQLECRLGSRLALFGGVQFVGADGRTVAEGAQTGDETFPLRFGTSSVRAGVLVLMPKRNWTVFAGGGASYSTYHEEWMGAPISVSGATYGFVAQAGARRVLTGPISLSGVVEYSYVPADSDASSGGSIDLGGLGVSLGVGIRF
jgi:hypothetical protein